MSNPVRIYWDACAWIGLVNEEPEKVHALRLVWEAAKHGKCEIWTSTYIYMEFMKGKLPHGKPYTPEENDASVETMLSQSYVKRIQLDVVNARMSRKLYRELHADGLRKRADAIHLAAAIISNSEELHTYDRSHLLQFDKKLKCKNGNVLRIIKSNESEFGANLFSQMIGAETGDAQ